MEDLLERVKDDEGRREVSTELALVQRSPDEIEVLPARQQGQMITQYLIQSKLLLERAVKEVDLAGIADFKAWASGIAEMTRQRGLGEEIQIDALEMVRRAERGIGKAIRNGQEVGVVRGNGLQARREHAFPEEKSMLSPSDFFSGGGHQRETYAMTDGVPDEVFEEALEEAREEKNLSRRNVIRKIQARLPVDSVNEPGGEIASEQAKRVFLASHRQEIEEWARDGVTSRQIAERLGARIDSVTKFVRANAIDVPADRVVGKTHRINPERVIQETVNTLQGVGYSLSLLSGPDYNDFSTDQIQIWLKELNEPTRAIRRLMKELNSRAR